MVTLVFIVIAGSRADAGQTSAQTATFAKDVAPIIFARCVGCHRPGEVAPMSLLTYADVRPWIKAIRAKVVAREMPPWGADPRYGVFANNPSLTPEQIQTVARWVDAGAPKGNEAELPSQPSMATGWEHGVPDYVVEMPAPYRVPAEGELNNLYFWVPVPFQQDRFARLLEFRPGNRSVVHHGTNHVGDPPRGSTVDRAGELVFADGSRENDSANEHRREDGADLTLLINYVPGRSALPVRAPHVGWRIPAGKYIRFNLHYQPSGRPESDQSRLGIWWSAESEVQELYKMKVGTALPTAIDQQQFYQVEGRRGSPRESQWPSVPAFSENYTVMGVTPVVEAITLYGYAPHMHLRGKDMTWFITYPDGRTQTLLSIPKYDFNWQLFYELQQPLKIPAGSTITNLAHYDNSASNKYNPAPDRPVFWSEQSWDEMYTPSIMYTVDSEDTPARERQKATSGHRR
jgi:hypothetical protein